MKSLLVTVLSVVLLSACGEDKSIKEYADEFCECSQKAIKADKNPQEECKSIVEEAKETHGDDAKEEFLKALEDCEMPE